MRRTSCADAAAAASHGRAGAFSEVHVLVESVQDHPCDPRACRDCESLAGAIAVTHLLPRACRSTTELVKNPFGPETVESGAAKVRHVSSAPPRLWADDVKEIIQSRISEWIVACHVMLLFFLLWKTLQTCCRVAMPARIFCLEMLVRQTVLVGSDELTISADDVRLQGCTCSACKRQAG